MERRKHLKATAPQSKLQAESQNDSFFPQKLAKRLSKQFTRKYMHSHTLTEIVNYRRSTALKRSEKTLLVCVCVCVCVCLCVCV